jgi:hypothetical protein
MLIKAHLLRCLPQPLLFLLLLSFPLSAKDKPNETQTHQEEYEQRSQVAEKWVFETLPYHIGQDLKEAFWNPWHLGGLAVGVGTTIALHSQDSEVQGAFHPEEPLGPVKDVFNWIGHGAVLGGTTFTAFVVTKLVDHEKGALASGTMLESLALTYALTFPIKLSTGRLRPDGSNRRSFPSAHASGAFSVATVTEVLYGPLIGVPAYLLASLVAVARLDANKHYLSDTVAGALLGTLIGLGTAKFHKKEKQRLFLSASVVESTTTIGLTRLF